MITIKHADALSAGVRKQAMLMGQQLLNARGKHGSSSKVHDGYICRAVKNGSDAVVTVIQPPGQLVGCNDYVDALDPIAGESLLDGIVISAAPPTASMAPTGPAVEAFKSGERLGDLGTVLPIGDPLPGEPHLLYASYPVEFAGGVIFPMCYGTAAAKAAMSAGGVTTEPVWWVFSVRWSGLGPARSVSVSDAYVQASTGGFSAYPRRSPDGPVRVRYGARLPACHYDADRMVLALEVEKPGGTGVEVTVGALLCLGVGYANGAALIEWSRLITPGELDAALVPDTFSSAEGSYQVSGVGHPAVFSWQQLVGGELVRRCVVSGFAACRRLRSVDGATTFRKVSGQFMLAVSNGVEQGIQFDYLDSGCGADYPLPKLNAAKIYSLKQRDAFFLSLAGGLVRFRAMQVQARPAEDLSIGLGGPANFALHADLCYLRTESAAGTVQQVQGVIGAGPEHHAAGAMRPFSPDATDFLGFATLAADGERWLMALVNGTAGAQAAIMAVKAVGVTGFTEAGISTTLRVSVYQQEVKDEQGAVTVPLAALATLVGSDGIARAAVKKGRGGILSFLPAAAYSRWGTFYLGNPIGKQKLGRMFG